MTLLVSLPLGIMFGIVTWAAVRGRGGLLGLVLFTFFASVAAFVGGFAAEAIAASVSDAVTGAGAVVGAAIASLVEVVGFGISNRRASSDAVASLSD